MIVQFLMMIMYIYFGLYYIKKEIFNNEKHK